MPAVSVISDFFHNRDMRAEVLGDLFGEQLRGELRILGRVIAGDYAREFHRRRTAAARRIFDPCRDRIDDRRIELAAENRHVLEHDVPEAGGKTQDQYARRYAKRDDDGLIGDHAANARIETAGGAERFAVAGNQRPHARERGRRRGVLRDDDAVNKAGGFQVYQDIEADIVQRAAFPTHRPAAEKPALCEWDGPADAAAIGHQIGKEKLLRPAMAVGIRSRQTREIADNHSILFTGLSAGRDGGEGGIRTPGPASGTQRFQRCSIGHSDTSPCVSRIRAKGRNSRSQIITVRRVKGKCGNA